MALEILSESVDIIQKLGDNPNTDDNLSPELLKMKFDEAAGILKKYLNEQVIPYINKLDNSFTESLDSTLTEEKKAAQAKAVGEELKKRLLLTGGTMAGPINMGGNVIGGLGNPTGYDQPVPYRMFLDELAKKAPTGYGLGTVSTSTASTYVDDANTATLTGWYKIDSNTANGIGSSAILRVEAYASTYTMQTAIRANGGVISMRYCNNGTWTEWKSTVDYIGALSTSGGTVNGPVNINGAVTMAGNVSYSGGDINMNSRKIWNLAPPTSSQDAVNKAYADDLYAKNRKAIDDVLAGKIQKFSLLWQNASPNSLFGAQTISVDLSAYDTVMIVYNYYVETAYLGACFVPKFCYGQMETVMTGGRYRTLFVGNEGVTFENQLMADGSAGSNNYCIPSQIFGCDFS